MLRLDRAQRGSCCYARPQRLCPLSSCKQRFASSDPETINLTARPLSYAQNLEDYHLSLAFSDRPTGTYIDIGGGHPVAGSVSFWFYERAWQGIVVEPQQKVSRCCTGNCDRATRS